MSNLPPIVGMDEVRESMCQDCGNIPRADWHPYWVYDEFSECTCLPLSDCCGADILDTWYGTLHLVNCSSCGEPIA